MAAPDPGSALLQVDQLVSHYGPIRAIHGISIDVHAGELVAIVGANGAGKTTLLHTLSGVHRASSGSIRFNGRDITRLRPDRIVGLGICQVPEGRQVFANLSVQDNLHLGAYAQRGDTTFIREQFESVYELFPILEQKREETAGTLSGGQQQMLAIGRALMGRPRLLLLDEPSMGLAPLLVAEIFRVVRELHESGVTVLLVEQNARAALRIADRGYVLETGKVVLGAPAAELLSNEAVQKAYLGH